MRITDFKNHFKCMINPLFMLFELERIGEEGANFETNLVYQRDCSYEKRLTQSSKDYKKFVSSFVKCFRPLLRLEKNKSFSLIMLVTFILFFFIAINPNYRRKFFLYLENEYVPCITASVFENTQPGLNNTEMMTEILFSEECIIIYETYGLSLTFFDPIFFRFEYGSGIVFAWFSKLNACNKELNLFASTKLVKRHFYNLNKMNILLGLSVKYANPYKTFTFWLKDSWFNQLKEKSIWFMIAMAIECCLVSNARDDPIYDDSKALNSVETSLNEKELSEKIGKFIQWDCKDYLLQDPGKSLH